MAETLEEVLAECGDGVLQALRVVDVEPAPDASRLLVTVAVDGQLQDRQDRLRVHEHLARGAGHLRSEVAGAITRKRAPVLVYRLAVPDSEPRVGLIRRWRSALPDDHPLQADRADPARSMLIGRSRKARMVDALVRRCSVTSVIV